MISWFNNKKKQIKNPGKIVLRSEKIEGQVIKEIETISSSYVPIKLTSIRKYQSVAKMCENITITRIEKGFFLFCYHFLSKDK